jgi:four helix bundle protein
MAMDSEELKKRTKQFALRMLQLAESLPRTPSGRVLANQIAKCGTSVAANYRAACRGKSTADFIAKLGTVEEEADESAFWLEFIKELLHRGTAIGTDVELYSEVHGGSTSILM